jgi:hypothetical protein
MKTSADRAAARSKFKAKGFNWLSTALATDTPQNKGNKQKTVCARCRRDVHYRAIIPPEHPGRSSNSAMSNVMLIPLKNPGYLKISNFLGDPITLPTSQKRVYGHFRALPVTS